MAEKTVYSGINKVGDNYYQSKTVEYADGGVGSTLFRVEPDGSSGVPVYNADRLAGSTSIINSFDSNATEEEQRLLSDPNSALSKARSQQITSSNPYADSPTIASPAAAQPAAGAAGATAPAAGATPAGDAIVTEGSSPVNVNQGAGSRVNNYSYKGNDKPTLVYPVKRKGEAGSDYIKFTVLEYKKSGLSSPTNVQAGGVALVGMEYRERNPLAYVYLPIQNGIIDSMSVDWGSGEINPITAAFASAAFGTISQTKDAKSLVDAAVNQTKIVGDKFMKASGELQLMSQNFFTQRAVGVEGLLSRTMGAAINNNLELLFNGPMLRSFTFNFKLTPRNADEAELIKQIIRTFKKSMVPSLSTAQLFLLAPNVFKIQYIYTGKGDKNDLHPYLNKIKVAALRDFSVNYAPDGNYMTYRDGSMTQYDLSMTFGEIDPIYEQDYERDEGLTGMGW